MEVGFRILYVILLINTLSTSFLIIAVYELHSCGQLE